MYNNKLYGEEFYHSKGIPNKLIEELYLSNYTYGKLKKYGHINDLYNLLDCSEESIKGIRTFGDKGFNELQDRLDKMGVVLYPGEELVSKTDDVNFIKVLKSNNIVRLIPILQSLGIESVYDLLKVGKKEIIKIIDNSSSSEKAASDLKKRVFSILYNSGYYFDEETNQRNEERKRRAEMIYREYDFSIYNTQETEEDIELKKLKTKLYAERSKYNKLLIRKKEIEELILLKEQLLNNLDNQVQEMEKKKILSK